MWAPAVKYMTLCTLWQKKAVPADAKATNELKNKEASKQFKIEEDRKAASALADKIKDFTKRITVPFLGGVIIGIIIAILII